jgi:hypothetical protein
MVLSFFLCFFICLTEVVIGLIETTYLQITKPILNKKEADLYFTSALSNPMVIVTLKFIIVTSLKSIKIN